MKVEGASAASAAVAAAASAVVSPLSEYKEEYEKVRELGRGRFGIVHLVRSRKRKGELSAAKHVRARRRDVRERTMDEINIVSQLSRYKLTLKFCVLR